MVTESEYRQRILRYDWNRLGELWQGIQGRDTPGWDPGKAMEYLVLRAFELEGAQVKYPYSVLLEEEELEQIDGALYLDHLGYEYDLHDYGTPFYPSSII